MATEPEKEQNRHCECEKDSKQADDWNERALSVIVGVDEVLYWRLRYRGDAIAHCPACVLFDAERNHPYTLAAVESCVKKHMTEVVSVDASRTACAAKHESIASPLELGRINGDMSLDSTFDTGRNATIDLLNKLTSFIVTEVSVEVYAIDGSNLFHFATSAPVWLEPGKSLSIPFVFTEDVHFRNGDQWLIKWKVSSARGVRIAD